MIHIKYHYSKLKKSNITFFIDGADDKHIVYYVDNSDEHISQFFNEDVYADYIIKETHNPEKMNSLLSWNNGFITLSFDTEEELVYFKLKYEN